MASSPSVLPWFLGQLEVLPIPDDSFFFLEVFTGVFPPPSLVGRSVLFFLEFCLFRRSPLVCNPFFLSLFFPFFFLVSFLSHYRQTSFLVIFTPVFCRHVWQPDDLLIFCNSAFSFSRLLGFFFPRRCPLAAVTSLLNVFSHTFNLFSCKLFLPDRGFTTWFFSPW